PRIAIIGAGPGGLVLLNVLARHNVSATLYERDLQFDSRAHLGGTLDLHEESGQAAMKAAGLWKQFVQNSRPEGEEVQVMDKRGEPLFHHIPPPGVPGTHERPEIDRTLLRQILLDGAPEGSVKFGHAFVSATPAADGNGWEVSFANGFKTTVDLLVGADGAHSRVRPLVSDAKIQYTGLTGIEVSFDASVAQQHPDLDKRAGNGAIYAFDDRKTLTVMRNGDGRIRTYAFFFEPESFELPTAPREAIDEVLSRYTDWAPWMRQLLELADLQAVYPRKFYILPVGHSWEHRKGVTLLGDAMNLMTPFAGKGANTAMQAAFMLGLAIAGEVERNGSLDEVDAAVAKYEQEI
ncbi:FAD/NAD(P)-binding domain-containing protein, partial [Exidia glandulosa HHB12029]